MKPNNYLEDTKMLRELHRRAIILSGIGNIIIIIICLLFIHFTHKGTMCNNKHKHYYLMHCTRVKCSSYLHLQSLGSSHAKYHIQSYKNHNTGQYITPSNTHMHTQGFDF